MHSSITCGNASEDSIAFRGWFVGDLSGWAGGGDFGLRNTQALEIKWGEHPLDDAPAGRAEGFAPP